jgi:hypothetical protein
MFAQHVANLAPVWGRSQGTGHPGITFFNRGGGPITFDPLNRLDRQMNAHLFLFGPTGSGKSATLNNILNQVTAIYRPRLFIVEAGNSFGLFGDFAARLGLTVHRVKLAPGAGVSLAPFADAWRLVDTPSQVQTLDADDAGRRPDAMPRMVAEGDEQRDVLGELEITARLMITGGEDKEEARMTRADRSLIRQCILDAAQRCVAEKRTVLTRDVRDALRERARDATLPETRRARLLEMADAMDMFCQGVDGEMFDRPGTPWPEADITIVDLATFAREGYNAQLSIAYISLINTVNNIAERDQFLGRPIINVTDEGHIITKNPLLAPYVVKITKMWRKLGAWFWLATQNLDDLPKAAEPMLNMIEWWICLSMPPDEVEKIARFRELNASQKALMLSARKEAGKFSEGVILSKSMEVLFRAVPPSLYLAMAMTEPEEKAERFQLMQQHGISELDAAFKRGREDRPCAGHRTAGAGCVGLTGATRCACLAFARRHPWIGLLIVVTIAVASWMLLRAPHPATESMPLAAAGSEGAETGAWPALAVWPCRCALHGGRLRRPGVSVLPGLLPRAQALDRRPSRGELAVAPPAAVHARAGRDCRGTPGRVRGRDGRTRRVLAGSGLALRKHPRRRPGPAGGPALSRPHAGHAGLSRQRAPRCGHPCPGGGSSTAGHRGHAGPATARPRVRQDPPAARPRRRRCLAVGHRPARRRQHDRGRTRPFPRHARRRRR